MAEEPVVPAFNKGFDRLIVQLKENSKAEQDEQRRSRIAELKAQNDAVLEAKNAAAATLEELKKLDKNDKKNVKKLAEQLQTQKETIQKLEDARNDRKEEYKQGQETKNAILQMNNQTKEDAQTNKDTKSGIQEMKDALEKQKAEIEAQGGVATDSKKYNEAQLDIAQKELDLRKQSAKRDGISKAGQEEIDKEQKRINKERGSVFKNMLGALSGIGSKLEGVVGKGGVAALTGAAFLAIGAFLQSDTFQKMTDYIFDTLIPKLQEFYNAFFGEEGSFFGGIKKLFGDESGIGKIVLGLGAALALFVAFKFVGLLTGIGSLLSAVTGFGGKKGLGRFLGKGGMLKGAVTAFAGLGASLKGFMGSITGFASKGLDMVKNAGSKLMDSAKNMAKGALDLAKKGVDSLKKGATDIAKKGMSAVKTGAAALHSAPEKIAKGGADLAKAMGSDVAKGGSKVASSVKGTASKGIASAAKIFSKFPRLGIAAKLVPGLGAVLAAGQGVAILMDDKMSKDDKIKAFGGLLGGTLGSAGFAALGGLLGTAAFPGVGTIAGGLLGGVLGYFGGDYAGRKMAGFLLGEQTEEEKLASSFSDDAATPAPITVDDFGGGGEVIASDGADPGIDAFGGKGGSVAKMTSTPKAKFKTVRRKPSAEVIEQRKMMGITDNQGRSDFDIIEKVPVGQGGGQPIVVNAPSTTNAPVNNNSTTSSNNVIVEADPMFNRVSRYAI